MLLTGSQITLLNLDNTDGSLAILLVRWAVQVLSLCSFNFCKISRLSKKKISTFSGNIMLNSFRNQKSMRAICCLSSLLKYKFHEDNPCTLDT